MVALLGTLGRIKLPGNPCRYHFIGQRRIGEAGIDALPIEQVRSCDIGRIASPRIGRFLPMAYVWIGDGAMWLIWSRSRRNGIEMVGKRCPFKGRKGIVVEHEVPGKRYDLETNIW